MLGRVFSYPPVNGGQLERNFLAQDRDSVEEYEERGAPVKKRHSACIYMPNGLLIRPYL